MEFIQALFPGDASSVGAWVGPRFACICLESGGIRADRALARRNVTVTPFPYPKISGHVGRRWPITLGPCMGPGHPSP